jgi:adenine-specific DNA-methyltransferase
MDFPQTNFEQNRLQTFRELFPEVFSEQNLDLERLWEILEQDYIIKKEQYQLTWVGKKEARFEVQKPSEFTLHPQITQSVDFENAKNLFLVGDNLEVLKILQKSYFQKVKMIYIDPPYNTGNDSFVYKDTFQEDKKTYEKRIGVKDSENQLLLDSIWKKNTKESGRYHSNWLSMMYPRLALARPLLQEDGIIFISIDDNELYNLKLLLDEIFGEENFIGNFIWVNRTTPNDAKMRFATDHEYILVYAKNIHSCTFKGEEKDLSNYKNPDNDPKGAWIADNPSAASGNENYRFPIENPYTGEVYFPPKGRYWAFAPSRVKEWTLIGKMLFPKEKGKNFLLKKYLSDLKSDLKPISSVIQGIFTSKGTKELKNLFEDASPFKYPKPTQLLKLLISQITDNEDIILDFFAGSGTTAHAVLDLNMEQNTQRQFICVQMPEKYDSENDEMNKKYQTVSQVTQQRIQKVIERHKSQGIENKCLSFRVFELASPILKTWKTELENGEQLVHQLQQYLDNIRSEDFEKVIFEWMLKMGVSIQNKIEKKYLKDENYYILYHSENEAKSIFLLSHFSTDIENNILSLKPQWVVFDDVIFKGEDSKKINFLMKLRSENIMSKELRK